MKRLTGKDEQGYYVPENVMYGDPSLMEKIYGYAIDRLAHYEDLDEQGRLLILPVKVCVGDRLYHYWRDEEGNRLMISERVVEVGITGVWVSVSTKEDDEDDTAYYCSWDEIGKTRFLSPEEADKVTTAQ